MHALVGLITKVSSLASRLGKGRLACWLNMLYIVLFGNCAQFPLNYFVENQLIDFIC